MDAGGKSWWYRFAVAALSCLAMAGLHAQAPAKPIRVGMLLSGSEAQWSPFKDALIDGLRESGYVEGRNLTVVLRYGELEGPLIRSSAAELATMHLDAIVTSCTGTTRAVASAAPRTPVVFASIGDPVLAGLVTSLARPGGNITGRMSMQPELMPKRLEMLRKMLPEGARGGARIAVLMNTREPVHEAQWQSIQASAKELDLSLVRVELSTPASVDGALDALARTDSKGLLVFSDDPLVIENLHRIAAAAIRLRIPSISAPRVYTAAGGLMSFGMDMEEDWRLSAKQVVTVANGRSPSTVPVEQPTHPRLVINMKSAAVLGVVVPRELLLFADERIE